MVAMIALRQSGEPKRYHGTEGVAGLNRVMERLLEDELERLGLRYDEVELVDILSELGIDNRPLNEP